jgi:outer membrane protein OmpA-like peptidoglycan-associated protein
VSVALGALAQATAPAGSQATEVRESLALTYPEGKTITIKLMGTSRLPKANGEAKVERKKGATEIEIELDEMKPAVLFGGDFNTYILWSVSPEGYPTNLGEFVLAGNRSKLNVSTRLETFGLFVTAEPHYLVRSPSRFVVLENTRPTQQLGILKQTSQIRYRGYEGMYQFQRESLEKAPEARGEVRSELQQAQTAVRLAERAQAEKYALEKLTEARVYLRRAEEAVQGGVDRQVISNLGKTSIRTAYEAQQQAEEAAAQAAAEAERKAREAEEARLREEAQRSADEAARRRQAEEEARRQAEEAARLQAEEARRAAEEAARRQEAEAAAARAAADAERAAAEAERAAREREEARARMQQALGQVAETRDTARGLIVNLPDILFDFNKATLRSQAREVISRIAGILMVARGFRLKVEGHTDSVGSEEYNLELSGKRAQSVRDYLVSAGVSSDLIATQGLGESSPIADNSTAEGRQKNRRVEIVIEDTGEMGLP